MINVYIDPNSYLHLSNILFKDNNEYNQNKCREPYIYLKKYCFENGLNLNTIDISNYKKIERSDIYVSFDHKNLLRKIYWKFRDRKYPVFNINKFKKKILFHFEPPVVMPEINYSLNSLTTYYDRLFLTWHSDNSKINYFHIPQTHNNFFPKYWEKDHKLFLTIINSNRKVISKYKELLSQRIEAIIHFSEKNDIDLYGHDWDKPIFAPYNSKKEIIRKTYKGKVKNKYDILSNYKFSIAFENCELFGYITEKIFDCFYVGTIPIYLGAPDIEKYIPKKCFIDMRDFNNFFELEKFLKSLKQGEIQEYKDNILKFLNSDQYKVFTKEHFAEIFLNACLN